jgi:hypothetical protein
MAALLVPSRAMPHFGVKVDSDGAEEHWTGLPSSSIQRSSLRLPCFVARRQSLRTPCFSRGFVCGSAGGDVVWQTFRRGCVPPRVQPAAAASSSLLGRCSRASKLDVARWLSKHWFTMSLSSVRWSRRKRAVRLCSAALMVAKQRLRARTEVDDLQHRLPCVALLLPDFRKKRRYVIVAELI